MMLGFGLLLLPLVGGAVALVLGSAEGLRGIGSFRASKEPGRRTPRELLDECLARGEIDRDEYEAIRARLES